jgi:hypothetical protein
MSVRDSEGDVRTVVLSRKASAVQLETRANGTPKLGLICQLPPGARVELCGDGYSDRTVKVRYRDNLYFVFRNDIAQ